MNENVWKLTLGRLMLHDVLRFASNAVLRDDGKTILVVRGNAIQK